AYEDEDRFCRVVELDEVRENDYNLNISRYVDTLEPEEPIDVEAAIGELRRLEAERDAAAKRMDELLGRLGLG
ncbi:MAG: N-6 DNA methylase, partial [Sandaracinaceae bacterium]